jgi:hypothetical protein
VSSMFVWCGLVCACSVAVLGSMRSCGVAWCGVVVWCVCMTRRTRLYTCGCVGVYRVVV